MDKKNEAVDTGEEITRIVECEAESEIQVAFALNDPTGNFSRWVGSAIESILMCTKASIWFHILLDESVNEENKEKIKETIDKNTSDSRRNRLSFHVLNPIDFNTENKNVNNYTVASLYRFALPDILPKEKKVIYLDADVIFNCDIKELWNIDLGNNCLGAVHDDSVVGQMHSIIKDGSVLTSQYFNSGVLLMNLEKIRLQGNLQRGGMDFLNTHIDASMPDQDALNYLFRNQTYLLDTKWNCLVFLERRQKSNLRPVVYHYAGYKKPIYDALSGYDQLLLRMQANSAWGYSAIEDELIKAMGMMSYKIDQLQKLICKISDPCIKRIYYGSLSNGMRNIIRIIPPRNVDYFIDESAIEKTREGVRIRSVEELKYEQKNSFVILVLPEANNGKALQKLINLGLHKGEDFFVIPTLLKTEQGGYVY